MHSLFTIIFLQCMTASSVGTLAGDLKIEQPLLRSMFIWNDSIIVEHDGSSKGKFWVCDTTKKVLRKLIIENDSNILDLTETSTRLMAIVKRNDSCFLISRNKNAAIWQVESLFSEFLKLRKYKLVANDSLIALVAPPTIYYRRIHASWNEIPFDSLIDKHQLNFRRIPKHYLLTNNELYLGYNDGEWGGSLWKIPVVANNKIPFSNGKRILSDNIQQIAISKNGVLWIATGLAHLSLRESGIFTYKDDQVEKVLWSQPTLSLEEKSDLSAFFLRNGEVPYFIAPELGVYKLTSDKLDEVMLQKLYMTYSLKDYEVGSSPVGLYVDHSENLFVAQRSLGVLIFTKKGDSYQLKQLIFE